MIRLLTFLVFLLLLFVIFMVYLYNRLNVLQYALRTVRQDCLPALEEKNADMLEYAQQHGSLPDITKKLTRLIKKITVKTSYTEGVDKQNEFEHLFAQLLEKKVPRSGSAAHTLLSSIAQQEDDLASQKRFYNATAYDHNQQLETFPTTLIAQISGQTAVAFFDLTDTEKEGVQTDRRNK